MKTKVLASCLLLNIYVLSGCSESPTGPSSGGSILKTWDPYMIVHIFDAGRTQHQYIEQLRQNGALRGTRIDLHVPESITFSNWAAGQGLETLGIFPNEFLENADVADLFVQYVRMHPNIKHIEVGNETGLFIHMSPEEYTPIFLEIYERAKREFPDVEIIPNAPVGGADGARYLGRMLDLGVQELLNHPDANYRLNVVAVHCYAIASSYQYEIKSQVERIPASAEIWVTETGVENRSMHIGHVQSVYPRLRNLFRATRIYWYVLAGHGQFALLGGLAEGESEISFSPLYNQLVGQ